MHKHAFHVEINLIPGEIQQLVNVNSVHDHYILFLRFYTSQQGASTRMRSFDEVG